MKVQNLYRTALCFGFVLLFGFATAQQTQQSAEPKHIPSGPPGVRVTAKDTVGAYSLSEFVTQPGTGPVPHRHSREDESFYVIDGQLEFRIGERGENTFVANPGSFVFAPRGIPHAFKNIGTTPVRALVVFSPPGLEKFFEERTALLKELPTTDPSYRGRYKALTDKYGLEYSSDWSFSPKGAN